MIISPPLKWHDRPPDGSKEIPGYFGYRAAIDGSIWSCRNSKGFRCARGGVRAASTRWRVLRPDCRREDGRKRYTLRSESGTYRRAYGSFFVLEAFVGHKPDGMEACHCDGDCTNDAIDNLRWDTPIANKADMIVHGTRVRGESINTAKLTEDDVREIRRIGYPLRQHAIRLGVSPALISSILKRKVWKHVL